MTRDELVTLLRRSRASLDTLLGLTGEEAQEFQDAAFGEAEDLASEIAEVVQGEPDPGGVQIAALVPDEIPDRIRLDLYTRLSDAEAEIGRPLRMPDDPDSGKPTLRRALLDSIIWSMAVGDEGLVRLLASLLADLDGHRRTR